MAILKLAPSFKDYIWGGRRLIEEYHKPYEGDIPVSYTHLTLPTIA